MNNPKEYPIYAVEPESVDSLQHYWPLVPKHVEVKKRQTSKQNSKRYFNNQKKRGK